MRTSNVVLARNSRLPSAVFIVVAVAVTLSSRLMWAQTDNWTGGSGNWSIVANWSLGQVPSPSNDCDIPSGSAPTIDIAGTCQNLILASGSTIDMNPGYLDIYGTSLANSGTISIAGTPLNVGGNNANTVSLTGGGTISMNATNSDITGFSGVGGTLVNVDNTIQGQGQVGLGVISIMNQATISAGAGTLTVQPSVAGLVNTGTMQAGNGGTLSFHGGFSSTTFTNTGGMIEALSGGTVLLNEGTFVGGTLSSAGSGILTTGSGGENPILGTIANRCVRSRSIGSEGPHSRDTRR